MARSARAPRTTENGKRTNVARRALAATIALVGSTLVPLETATAQGTPPVFISEIHYDNAGADAGEFVEVEGPAGTDLTGWTLVAYNGNGGAPYNTFALSGTIDDEGSGAGAVSVATANLQNGDPDGVALVDGGGAVVEFVSYEGSLIASGGPADGALSVDVGVAESSSTPAGQSLQLLDGTWIGPAPESPGTLNAVSNPKTVFISEVQGSGDVSPLVGNIVSISGIVVGDFQSITTGDPGDAPLDGFMVQEENADADADAETSEGVFVFAPGGTAVQLGDLVEVTGTVTEFFSLTEIVTVTDITVVSSDNPLPDPALPVLPTAVGEPTVDWEAIEGMGVEFAQPLFVTGMFPLGSFGELQLSAIGAQDHPNQTSPVGSPEASSQRGLNVDSRVILDDGEDEHESFPNGIATWNPTPTPYLGGSDNTLRSGDVVTGLRGVVHYAFGEYEVQPVNPADADDPGGAVDFTRTPRPTAAPAVGGSTTIASFNVLNYFTTIDNGSAICGPAGFEQRCRGADTQAEFDLQSTKIAAAIATLDADVVGLIELENSEADEALADLVAKVNARSDRTYAPVETGFIGTDAITVGYLYDTETIGLDGSFAVLDSSVSPAYIDDKNRPALAQTFVELGSDESITVVVNHLKSKGSSCETVANPGDPAFGVTGYPAGADVEDPALQGNCNLTRSAAAEVLGQWLAADPTGTGATNHLILGDLNAYANEDPIMVLEAQGYADLVEASAGGNSWALGAHSYVFDGEHGTLDYALANRVLGSKVTGAGVWHINADEPFAIDYQDFNPPGQARDDEWKSSDHDPVVVGVDLTPAGPTCMGLPATIVGTERGEVIIGTTNADVIVALGGRDRVFGRGGDDVICLGEGNDRALGQAGNDTILGEGGSDRIYGNSGDDVLDGGEDNDRLSGGAGDDILDGGPGARDRGHGGRGNDSCGNLDRQWSCEAPL